MGSRQIFASIGLLSILIITAWTHNSQWNYENTQAKVTNPKYKNIGLIEKACNNTGIACPLMAGSN